MTTDFVARDRDAIKALLVFLMEPFMPDGAPKIRPAQVVRLEALMRGTVSGRTEEGYYWELAQELAKELGIELLSA